MRMASVSPGSTGRRMPLVWAASLALALPALALSAPGPAEPRAHGPEFQVNSYTTSYQYYPSVAMDGAGNFVVVWQAYDWSGTDTDDYSIQGQRYDANGSPLGSPFQVNAYTTDFQIRPFAAMNGAGSFVVVWDGLGSSGSDTHGNSVHGQLYDANGSRLGSELQINSYTTNAQFRPSAAMDSEGNFVVIWESGGSSESDTSADSVQGQRFDANGSRLGSEFQINSYTTNAQGSPAVAMDGAGNFVVVWRGDSPSLGDASGYGILGQRFAANGDPAGSEFQVNSYTTGQQRAPAVAMDNAGNFVIVWSSESSSLGDASGYGILGQRFAANGDPAGSEFQINSYTTGYQEGPAAAMDDAGNFVVVWTSGGSSGGDNNYGIHGQRFDAEGNLFGSQFQVNTYATAAQWNASAAMDGAGNFVVAWQSQGSSGTDTDYGSIQGQLYDALFRDGFESGDVCSWSAAAGGAGCP